MKMQFKREWIRKIVNWLLILCGVGMLLYPIFSNLQESAYQEAAIRTYQTDVQSLQQEEIAGARAEAEAYNRQLQELVQLKDPFTNDFEAQNLSYEQLLNENADGVMAYIEIPAIQVYLPIYHGTSEAVLAKGAGHLLNTSLPVGGASTHCVISAHRGDPSASLFSDLDQLKEGDEFYLYTLGDKLTYRVDQIKVVLPYETDDFRIVTGKDYVTLVTCTPYGVNSHRLLIRGERVSETAENDEAAAESPDNTACVRDIAAVCIGCIAGIAAWRIRRKEKNKRHEKA